MYLLFVCWCAICLHCIDGVSDFWSISSALNSINDNKLTSSGHFFMSDRIQSFTAKISHGFNLLLEKILTFIVVPQLRVIILKLLGAKIGHNVRLHEIRFFSLQQGFRHLIIEDNVYIGSGTRIDLTGVVTIKRDSVISPDCLLLTHTDMGDQHSSFFSSLYPQKVKNLVIGESCYLGSRVVILPGSNLGCRTLVAAGAVVCRPSDGGWMMAGQPAREIKRFDESVAISSTGNDGKVIKNA